MSGATSAVAFPLGWLRIAAARARLRPPDVTGLFRIKLHEPCGARWVADVAHALLRAVSRLTSTPALLFDTVCESCARTAGGHISGMGVLRPVHVEGTSRERSLPRPTILAA